MEELITVEQLPIIKENLKKISDEIDKKVELANSLACTEDTVKDVKKARAEMSKQFKELESQRKDVKNKVMKPYNEFENVYKEYISNKFSEADKILKDKIDTVEKELKDRKESEVKDYFEEYTKSKEIDFITYNQANINVTLSASMKSLKEQAKMFIDRISEDMNLIKTQDYEDEIMLEYKKDLNVSRAITSVTDRHKELDRIQKEKEDKEEQKLTDEAMLNKIDECLKAPKVEKTEETEELVTATFKATCLKNKMIKLVNFMKEEGIEYEQCK